MRRTLDAARKMGDGLHSKCWTSAPGLDPREPICFYTPDILRLQHFLSLLGSGTPGRESAKARPQGKIQRFCTSLPTLTVKRLLFFLPGDGVSVRIGVGRIVCRSLLSEGIDHRACSSVGPGSVETRRGRVFSGLRVAGGRVRVALHPFSNAQTQGPVGRLPRVRVGHNPAGSSFIGALPLNRSRWGASV